MPACRKWDIRNIDHLKVRINISSVAEGGWDNNIYSCHKAKSWVQCRLVDGIHKPVAGKGTAFGQALRL